MIESRYWREDIHRYARKFRPLRKPPRFSERLLVEFEKDVTIAFFLVRRLMEAGKFSEEMRNYRASIFQYRFSGLPRDLLYKNINDLYDLESEVSVSKSVAFIANQFIHADMTYAYRGRDRNWSGIYATSDFEKKRSIYRIPVSEIVSILNLAVLDRPESIQYRYDSKTDDWLKTTN